MRIRAVLQQLVKFHKKFEHPVPFEEFILAHGTGVFGKAFPGPRATPKECFKHAYPVDTHRYNRYKC